MRPQCNRTVIQESKKEGLGSLSKRDGWENYLWNGGSVSSFNLGTAEFYTNDANPFHIRTAVTISEGRIFFGQPRSLRFT